MGTGLGRARGGARAWLIGAATLGAFFISATSRAEDPTPTPETPAGWMGPVRQALDAIAPAVDMGAVGGNPLSQALSPALMMRHLLSAPVAAPSPVTPPAGTTSPTGREAGTTEPGPWIVGPSITRYAVGPDPSPVADPAAPGPSPVADSATPPAPVVPAGSPPGPIGIAPDEPGGPPTLLTNAVAREPRAVPTVSEEAAFDKLPREPGSSHAPPGTSPEAAGAGQSTLSPQPRDGAVAPSGAGIVAGDRAVTPPGGFEGFKGAVSAAQALADGAPDREQSLRALKALAPYVTGEARGSLEAAIDAYGAAGAARDVAGAATASDAGAYGAAGGAEKKPSPGGVPSVDSARTLLSSDDSRETDPASLAKGDERPGVPGVLYNVDKTKADALARRLISLMHGKKGRVAKASAKRSLASAERLTGRFGLPSRFLAWLGGSGMSDGDAGASSATRRAFVARAIGISLLLLLLIAAAIASRRLRHGKLVRRKRVS